jgi:hypothetical protein
MRAAAAPVVTVVATAILVPLGEEVDVKNTHNSSKANKERDSLANVRKRVDIFNLIPFDGELSRQSNRHSEEEFDYPVNIAKKLFVVLSPFPISFVRFRLSESELAENHEHDEEKAYETDKRI